MGITHAFGLSLMDFVAFSILAGDLTRLFLAVHRGGYGQEPQSWQAFDITLKMVGVEYFHAHHLVAATDAQYRSTFTMRSHNSLGTTVTAQFVEVVQGRFCARQDDDVGFLDVPMLF